MVPGVAHLGPAGHHGALTIQVVPLASIEEPAGDHLAAGSHVVPAVVILSQLPAGEHASVVLEEVPGTVDVGPANCGGTAGAQPVPVVAILEPAGDHDTVSVHVVPGTGDLHPAGGHVAIRTQVVPLVVFLLPARHHSGGVIEEVAASVDGGPSADRLLVGAGPVPAAAGREPAGLGFAVGDEAPGIAGGAPGSLAQAVCLGDAGRVSNAKRAHEVPVAQEGRVGCGGHESMLNDDAGHVLFASLADDRVVVAGRAVRVVVVGVVTRLDAAISQPEAGQLLLDRVGQGAPLRVGAVVVRRGIRVPDLGTLRNGRGRVEVNGDERVCILRGRHLDAAGEVGAGVFRGTGVRRTGHDDADTVVAFQLFLQGQRDREGQVLLTQAVCDRAGVGAAVPGVDGNRDTCCVRGRHEGRCGCAEGQGEPGDDGPPRGAHSNPSCC